MRNFKIMLLGCIILSVSLQLTTWGNEEVNLNKDVSGKDTEFFRALDVVGTSREDKDTWKVLEELFSSDDYGRQWVAIRFLKGRAWGIPESRPKIISFLADVAVNTRDSGTCLRATGVIADYRDMEGVDEALASALRKLLKDKDRFIRSCAIDMALYDRLEIAIPILKEAMPQEKDKRLKECMAETIASLEKGICGRIGVRTALIANIAWAIITEFLIVKIFLCILVIAVVGLLIRKRLHSGCNRSGNR